MKQKKKKKSIKSVKVKKKNRREEKFETDEFDWDHATMNDNDDGGKTSKEGHLFIFLLEF